MLDDIEILDHYLKSKPDFATVNCCWDRIKTELAESTNSSHNISRDAMSRLMEAPVRSDDTRHPY